MRTSNSILDPSDIDWDDSENDDEESTTTIKNNSEQPFDNILNQLRNDVQNFTVPNDIVTSPSPRATTNSNGTEKEESTKKSYGFEIWRQVLPNEASNGTSEKDADDEKKKKEDEE